MSIVRKIVWVLLLVALAVFSIANWKPVVTLHIWPGLLVDTKIPVIAAIAFLIGFMPMWLYFRGARWQLHRRIQSLEAAARAHAMPPAVAPGETELASQNRPDPA